MSDQEKQALENEDVNVVELDDQDLEDVDGGGTNFGCTNYGCGRETLE